MPVVALVSSPDGVAAGAQRLDRVAGAPISRLICLAERCDHTLESNAGCVLSAVEALQSESHSEFIRTRIEKYTVSPLTMKIVEFEDEGGSERREREEIWSHNTMILDP
ncbi:hypothetical protein VTI28DRAFT_2432 [Corynascus sepedonium]